MPDREFALVAPIIAVAESLAIDAGIERASQQSNGALVVAFYGYSGNVESHIAAHTGLYLFWETLNNGTEYIGDNQPDAPGIYVLRGARVWSDSGSPANDWQSDNGISGDFIPASAEDMASFGMDDLSLARFLVELDSGIPEGIGAVAWYASDEAQSAPKP